MKTKILSIILALFFSISLSAQSGGGGYFFTGITYFPQIPQMNANISGVNNTLPPSMGMMGGGGFAIIKGLVIGGRGTGSAFTTKMNINGVKAEYTFGGGEFNLGHVILHRRSLLSFAYLGIGGYGYGVKLENNTDRTVDLNTVVLSPGSEVDFGYGSFTLTAGLSIKFIRLTGFDIGLDMSYIYPVSRDYQAVMVGITLGGLGVTKPESKE